MKSYLLAAAPLCLLALARAQTFSPNANLKTDGIPPISADLVARVAPYTEFRGHGFVDWHPQRKQMLVRHREEGANTTQIYRLSEPGGKLEKLTDFSDPVGAASFNPVHGQYLVYARASGGSEASQIYRLDLDTRQSTLLSDPDERSSARWTHKGDRLLIAALPLDRSAKEGRRDTVSTTLRLVDPLLAQRGKYEVPFIKRVAGELSSRTALIPWTG